MEKGSGGPLDSSDFGTVKFGICVLMEQSTKQYGV
ncbi:unnamed protein product [Tenebrio molitor]|nr:unnamed protein product [Tenebrio molitor]